MLKIAILSHIPVSKGLSGKEMELTNVAKLLRGKSTKVEIFSLSDESKIVDHGAYVEHEILNPGYAGRSTVAKAADMLSIFFFGTRPMLNKINKDQNLIKVIKEFDPDIIICGTFLLSKLLEDYISTCRRRIKVISIFDSQRVIYNYAMSSFGYRQSADNNASLASAIKSPIARAYINFNLKLYGSMLNVSDVHVVPTQKDKLEVEKFFTKRKARIVALPAQFLNAKYRNAKPRPQIRSILFVGSYSHPPNKEAMENIERIIAPMLPDKKFIIGGGGCPRKIVSNVHYIGTISDMKRTINDADLCIAPLTSGSGLKVKMLDYFGAGKAVIGTGIAFDGYKVRNGYDAIVEDNMDKYPSAIRDLEANKVKFALIQRNSSEVAGEFKFDIISRRWKMLILQLQTRQQSR